MRHCRVPFAILLSALFLCVSLQKALAQPKGIDFLFCRNILSGNLDSVKICLEKGASLNAFSSDRDSLDFFMPAFICVAYTDSNCLSLLTSHYLHTSDTLRSILLRIAIGFNNLPMAAYLIRGHYPLLIDSDDCETEISVLIETMKSEKEFKQNFADDLEGLRKKYNVTRLFPSRKNFNHVESDGHYNFKLLELLRAYQPASFSDSTCPVLQQLKDDSQPELRKELELAQYLQRIIPGQLLNPNDQLLLSRIAVAAGDHALLSELSKSPGNKSNSTYRQQLLSDVLLHGSVSNLQVLEHNGYNLAEEFSENYYYLIDDLLTYLPAPGHSLTKKMATVADYFIHHGYQVNRKNKDLPAPLESFCNYFYSDSSEAAYDLLNTLAVTMDSITLNKSLLYLYEKQQTKGFTYLLVSRDSIALNFPALYLQACQHGDEKLLALLLREIKDPLNFDFTTYDGNDNLSDLTIYYYTLLYLKSDLLNNQHFYPNATVFEDSLKYFIDTYTSMDKFQGFFITQLQDKVTKQIGPSFFEPDKTYYKDFKPERMEKRMGCQIDDDRTGYPIIRYTHRFQSAPEFIDLNLPELSIFLPFLRKADIYFNCNASAVIPQLVPDFANPLVFPQRSCPMIAILNSHW